jgi:anthranilate phosphoribosyltransferase
MTGEHPFAKYVRIIGRGPNLSRPLTEDEAFDAMRLILEDRVEPLQLGAFLCVLRVREEVPEEGAGMVRAIRHDIVVPADAPPVELDWSSYAGKLRQLPWFLLSALLLAQAGVRLFMHGTEGHTPGRIYARQALQALGVPIAGSLGEAAAHLGAANFAFLPLAVLCPRLQEIIDLKPIIGLRTPANTFGRVINPFAAPYEMQAIFHPGYRDIHRQTSRLLGQPHMAVFKGEGGEAERRPHKPVLVQSLDDGALSDEDWPALLAGTTVEADADMDLARLGALWRGEAEDVYGRAAVTGTAAIALRLLGRAGSAAEAEARAADMWEGRERSRLVGSA